MANFDACACDNYKAGFNCSCEWERAHPGRILFGCEWCGLYMASKPKCNKCEAEGFEDKP